MKTIVHVQWSLVGQIMVVDENGETVIVGKDPEQQPLKSATVNVPVSNFRADAFTDAFEQARGACAKFLERFNEPAAPARRNSDAG